jgi:P4 family phage/plasmid primase-like protien
VVYNGKVWVVDTGKVLIESLAKAFLKWWAGKATDRVGAAAKVLADAQTKNEQTAAEKAHGAANDELTFAIKTQDFRNLKRMIEAARSEYGVLVARYSETFDCEETEHLLNFENGTVDLRTGELRPHDRAYFITKIIPIKFDADAACPLYLRTLNAIFDGNKSLVDYVRRFFGVCATGDVTNQTLHILFGKGANGKTTLLELMILLFGDYAAKVPEQLLLKDKHGSRHPAEKVVLAGLRLAVTSETDQSGRLDESRVKELTGTDSISARGMKENFFTFPPTHKLIVATNHKPKIVGTDHGIWRRIRLVRFNVRFWKEEDAVAEPHGLYDPDLKADPLLLSRLNDEAAGIMADVVKEAAEFYKAGKVIIPPKEVVLATKEYRKSEDTLAQFFDEMVDVGGKPFAVKTGYMTEWFVPADVKENWIKGSVLYGNYKSWCVEMNLTPEGTRTFGEYAKEVLGDPKRSNGHWYFGKMKGENWLKVEQWNSGTENSGSSESKKSTPQGSNPGNDFHSSTIPRTGRVDEPYSVFSDDSAWRVT